MRVIARLDGVRSDPRSLEADRGPDGNSVFLDTSDGLILVDTGRHPAHRDRLLGYCRPLVSGAAPD